jgi:hypothetical protein
MLFARHAGLDKPAPDLIRGIQTQNWIPAFAGMTTYGTVRNIC